MGFESVCPDGIAVEVWNLMGGQIDWSAVPVVVPLFGIEDVELLISQLLAIRRHVERTRDASRAGHSR